MKNDQDNKKKQRANKHSLDEQKQSLGGLDQTLAGSDQSLIDDQQGIITDNDQLDVDPSEELIISLKGQLARALADYDNLRKRTEAEKISQSFQSSVRIIFKLLPILDMLEGAQRHLNDQGLAISIAEFKKVLAEEGLEQIDTKVGELYQEEFEEVIDLVDGPQKGKITEVLLTGWQYKDELVVRHTKVKVEKGVEN